ncbi:hypothetical protein TRVA0_003S00980 [Trichomonascus vanleenenianus]|uniref:Fmp10p n=1 Tax=Trichomonascus vanleenenianus TaxID=2268995 RepID=UPI003ECADD02
MATLLKYSPLLAIGAGIGYLFPPFRILRLVTEHELPTKGSLAAGEYSDRLEMELLSLPLVKKLQCDGDYHMYRAWSHRGTRRDDDRLKSVFTAGTLRTPGGLSVTPLVFVNEKAKSTVSIVHCGRLLTGFPMIVHGGVLSTLLDEALGRTAFLSFDQSTGVTANLKINYRAPTLAHQFLVVRTWTDDTAGNKANVRGTIETTQGKQLVQASGLFVVPKKFQLTSMKGF